MASVMIKFGKTSKNWSLTGEEKMAAEEEMANSDEVSYLEGSSARCSMSASKERGCDEHGDGVPTR